jgi:hypothetical protein
MGKTLPTVGQDPTKVWLGIYGAVVYNTDDPLGESRIQMHVPQVMGTAISNWADPMTYLIKDNVPTVGTYVLAQFTGGDINRPVYIY